MNGRLRVGLAGAGWVSAHHLTAWGRCAEAEVVAVADPDPSSAAARAAAFGVPRTFASPEAMLDAVPVDVVDVCAPMAAHGAIARAAADRGIAVICQKPLAPTAAEARAIVADVGDRVRLVVHENWRFRPQYRRIRAWLDEGRIGAPGAFLMTHVGSGHSPSSGDPPAALVRQPFQATLDRLLVWETLIHHLDTLAYLLGPLRLASARLDRLSSAVRGEDTATIALHAEACGGMLVACSSAVGAPARPPDAFTLWGRAGTIAFDGTVASLTRAGGSREEVRFDPAESYQASYDAAVAHYAHCLRTGAPFESPPADHLAVLDLAEAIYAAGKP